MSQKIQCAHCGGLVPANPRMKDQRFCGRKECQRARKNLWQRQKLASDPDYQANQRDCFRNWYKRHPVYWRQYRRSNSDYCQRNRLLQRLRDKKRRSEDLAKMDASAQKVLVIPIG